MFLCIIELTSANKDLKSVCVCGYMMKASSNSKFFKQINQFIAIVATNRTVNRYVLARQMGLTPRQYAALAPYVIEAYSDVVEYNVSEKTWNYLGDNGFINKEIINEEDVVTEKDDINEE